MLLKDIESFYVLLAVPPWCGLSESWCILPFRLCRRTSDPGVCRLATDVSRIDSQFLSPYASSIMHSRRVQNGWIWLGEQSGRLPNNERDWTMPNGVLQAITRSWIWAPWCSNERIRDLSSRLWNQSFSLHWCTLASFQYFNSWFSWCAVIRTR